MTLMLYITGTMFVAAWGLDCFVRLWTWGDTFGALCGLVVYFNWGAGCLYQVWRFIRSQIIASKVRVA